jgi:general secretion pathway protein I
VRSAGTTSRGFTLIEVLVALAIVALGMGAVLGALTSAAGNVQALRDKTLAQWIALNQVADARLSVRPPSIGTTEGDINSFGNGNWHWQRTISSVDLVPGLLQITLQVRHGSPSGVPTAVRPPDWITSVTGFRGDSLALATGDQPDWTGTAFASASSSSSSGAGSGGAGNIANPGTSPSARPGIPGASPGTGGSGTTPPATGSSGGN